MVKTLLLAGLLLGAWVVAPAECATWYVDASVPSSGDGSTWDTAFKTIQEGIDASSHGDSVQVGQGVYAGEINLDGKNIVLSSTNPRDLGVVAATIIEAGSRGVGFWGTEDQTCVLSGFTLRHAARGVAGGRDRATIENNVITSNQTDREGGGIAYCDGIIRNNTFIGNYASDGGGAIAHCNGLIENNVIMGNCVGPGWCASDAPLPDGQYRIEVCPGAGLYDCNGTIRGNLIVGNIARGMYHGLWEDQGWGGGLAKCSGVVENNIICDNHVQLGAGGGLWDCDGVIRNNVIVGNRAYDSAGGGLSHCDGMIRNCIIWGNTGLVYPQLYASSKPTYSSVYWWTGEGDGNIADDPRFVDPDGPDDDPDTYVDNDYRLMPDSPCIDAGFNDPQLPETDIVGMHRIMFGGKSLTVDMGAYEFYINDLTRGPNPDQTTFTWSSLSDKTYSIFYTEDLLTWHLAIESFPSSGNETTLWIDDGSKTGLPPSLVPLRFYRTLGNP